MGRIPELLGGRSEEEPGLVKFKGKMQKKLPPQPGVGAGLSVGGAS